MSESNIEVSICICTYNRADSLKNTLLSICGMTERIDVEWEVLIVDNNSADDTRTVVEGFKAYLPIRYVFENKQGLSHARNKSVLESKGELLIFTDDDVRVESKWLSEFFKASQDFPEAEYFGGRILPFWPRGRPKWFKQERMALLDGLFPHYDLGLKRRLFKEGDPVPYGGSIAFRRRLFDKVGMFRIDLGVCGDVPGRGEEYEYIIRAKNAGYMGVYVGTAVCYHEIHPKKERLSFIYKFGVQKGIAEVRIKNNEFIKGSYVFALLYLVKGLYQLVKGRGDRFRQCVINAGIQVGICRMKRHKLGDFYNCE